MKKFTKDNVWYGSPCFRCKGDNQPYMVYFTLWNKLTSKKEKNKYICIPCIEQQLGRKLKQKDFIKAPINEGYFGFCSKKYSKGTSLQKMKQNY